MLRKGGGSMRNTSKYVYILFVSVFFLTGCKTPSSYRKDADGVATGIIQEKQKQVLGRAEKYSIERPSDILRRRLLTEQNLPYSSQASLGTDKLKAIPHWPEKDYPADRQSTEPILFPQAKGTLKITMLQALQIGARNSSEYQGRKEDVFRVALDLDLERNEFRNIFNGQVEFLAESDAFGKDTISGTQGSAAIGWDKKFKSGVDVSTALAIDLANLLTIGGASSMGVVGDATISIPLLRGSGEHIVAEPLTQAERNVVYAIYEFERFRKVFAVDIASKYLEVLNLLNEVQTTRENYRSLITVADRSRKLAEAGRLSEVQADQAVQNELRNRRRWITAIETYKNRLDAFKRLIGLPPDAAIKLDRAELEKLLAPGKDMIADIVEKGELREETKTPAVERSVELIGPSRENAGPFEINETRAIKLSLKNRLDLRVSQGKVFDAQRKVVVLADALRAELTLFGKAELGQSRSLDTANSDNARLRLDEGVYSALLFLDLPFERTAERNAFRDSYISLERAVREVQNLEDNIKLSIRTQLRDMLESRERLNVQSRSKLVAEKRVKSVSLFLEAGRAQIRDLTEAQEALFQAQNGMAAAVTDYRIAELEFQRDTGLLKVDEKGLWQEYMPKGIENDK
jgi:outer membrane protein TolC